MTHKSLIIFIAIILATNGFFIFSDISKSNGSVQPKFYVDDDYDNSTPGWGVDHFDTISEAINASSGGDRIIVNNGTYTECLTISHKLDIFGEDKDTTIISGSDNDDVVVINAEHVNISRFTIKDSGNATNNSIILINADNTIITDTKITSGKNGITLKNSNSNIIYDNIITDNNGVGIYLNNSNNNQITYNLITSNTNGLFLHSSSNNEIENNSAIKSNSLNGIFLNETCNSNSIANNNISSNSHNGIFLNDHCNYNSIISNQIYTNNRSGIRNENSSNNVIRDCNVVRNTNYGIFIVGAYNMIKNSNIKLNSEHGIFLFADDHNTIYNNIIRSNTKNGLHLVNSTNDTIYSNEIYSNTQYGIYVDYFTFDNLVYNNYFHDNTYNSIDKSLNHNSWNISKTNGTNKIGGPYLCGNYWDDFDESSEGAIDTNNDGISNTSYTIYSSNKDEGVLLDVTPPSVTAKNPSPSTQTIGGYTYLSATVTDNTELKQVNLIVTGPNGISTNFSIIVNKTGTTYYCNKIFSTVGNYSYYIAAKDPRNWATSSTKSFIIDAGTPPTITDNSPPSGSPSGTYLFNATVTDDADAANYLKVYVEWSHDDLNDNNSMILASGNYFFRGITLDNSTKSLTYKITALDRWGNSRTTDPKTVPITDSQAPLITIKKRNYSSDGVIKTYTIGAEAIDNHEVSQVQIEYWYSDSDHKIAEMDYKGNHYYEKVIQIEPDVDRVYCIINATDPSGNTNNTKKPFANASGPYSGINGIEVPFDASNSFDLDGSISSYSWDFGDGTTGTGAIVGHAYSTNGNYTVSMTVTDNDGKTNTSITYVDITQPTQIITSTATKNKVETDYDVILSNLFYCYDTDGDGKSDTFIDPNNVLKSVHTGYIDIDNNTVFLISTDDTTIPEFMWNTTTDEVIDITYMEGKAKEAASIDTSNKILTQEVDINKTQGWIYLEVSDPEISEEVGTIDAILSVTKDKVEISSDKIFRKNSITYVLDDPEVSYEFKYSYTPPTLKTVTFDPKSGSTIDKNNQTILIKFNVPVVINSAEFYMIDPITWVQSDDNPLNIKDLLVTSDNKNFTFSPPNNLEAGKYQLYLHVKEKNGIKILEVENTWYEYIPFAPEEMKLPMSLFLMLISGIFVAFIGIFAFLRYKNIGFESFIYIKNKKIIPFFKPIIFGPLSIDVNDERVSKAEFYVNGKLKDTLTKEPFVWKLDDPMFMKQKIETKVYDEKGNSSSSGEMTFYIFNPPHLFK